VKLANIAPITELKRDAAGLIEKAAGERSPIVITQNGRATAVLQDVESYEEQQRELSMLKLVLQGEQEIRGGRGLSHAEHRKRVARLLGSRKRT